MKKYRYKIVLLVVFILALNTMLSATIQNGVNDWGSKITYHAVFSADNVLDKPLIIVEGFDVLNNYGLDDLYNGWSIHQEDFIFAVREAGYDIILVNLVENTNGMLENSLALINFIKDVNASKSGNFEGIVIGMSMSGILLRIALANMEEQNYDHQMGIYISLDSPHRGANLPVGMQTLIKDAVKYIPVNSPHSVVLEDVLRWWNAEEATPAELNNTLNSVAAQQLIFNHDNGPTYYQAMQTYLANLGYPNETRNIAVVCGSNTGAFLPFQPGARLLEKQVGACGLIPSIYVAMHTVGLNQTTTVSKIETWVPPCLKVINETSSRSNGNFYYDNCPGGRLDYNDENNTPFEDLIVQINGTGQFSFVPVVSAIDMDLSLIQNNQDLAFLNNSAGHTKDDIINAGLTPFDDIYSDPHNRQHIALDGLVDEFNAIVVLEFMLDNFFMQNRTIKYNRTFEYEAITTGRSVNNEPEKNWDEEDVVFKSGATVNLTAETITIDEGTTIESGCDFTAANP